MIRLSSYDIDSTFIYLKPKGEGVLMYAVHANVPDNAMESLNASWHKMYWESWKLYLDKTAFAKTSI